MKNKPVYQSFIKNVLEEKKYLIYLCLKNVHSSNYHIDDLYEKGILSLYYVYKYFSDEYQKENFDFLAYQFILSVMNESTKHDIK